ncbi:MAG: hypothetical protein K2X91_01970, partial [Thermoleophilia bacterium]|nr:hypothetical protein [Thermoleophilia bacterium]
TPDAPAVLDAGPTPILSDPTSRLDVRRGSDSDLPCEPFALDPTGRLSPRVASLSERPDATPARGPGLIVLQQRWTC